MAEGPSKPTTITIDATTVAAIERLMTGLNASSVADVVRKALGLASLAIDNADTKGVVSLQGDKTTSVDLKA